MGTLQFRSGYTLAQGHTGTMSKRPTQYIQGVYPTHLAKARGPYVWDDQGQRYVDFIGGLGVSSIGYNHPAVVEAVQKQASEAVSLSLPHPIEVEVAEILLEMIPCIDRVRFLKTGSEACTAAIRIARAHLPIESQGLAVEGYHGWHDQFTYLTPPAAGVTAQVSVSQMHDMEAHDIAIIEPIELDDSEERKAEVQKMLDRYKCVIFDEVVSGMRVPQATTATWWNMEPDIMCLGKGIASGYPLAVVAGKESYMDQPDYFVSSTYSGDAVSLAACKETLKYLRANSIKELYFYANKFVADFNTIMKPHGVEIKGYGTRGMLDTNQPNVQVFMEQACRAGLLFGKAFFYNFSHMESNVDEYVLGIVHDISMKMGQGLKLEGKPPEDVFKR